MSAMPDLPRSSAAPVVCSDRLYGISMRPQELSLYGEKVTFSVRYSPIFDDENEETDRHFKLLVLEISADIGSAAPSPTNSRQLQLVKCGWELELETPVRCRVGTLGEQENEVPMLLGRIADTVNDLARRAGIEAPLGPDLIADLVDRYRAGSTSS